MKLLVTGASGFLGWNVCQVAAPDWEIYGTTFSHSSPIPGATLLTVDLRDERQLREVFQQIQPDAVIHLAAQSSPNECQNYPETSYLLNVAAACHIATLCAETEIPLAFTSTDLVFDGLNAPYRETDPVSPRSVYGEQKAIAETEILKRYPKAAICRMPLMFGAAPPHASSFISPFAQALREERELRLFVDEFRTPVSGTTAAKGLLMALDKVEGIIHLGGQERISRYNFGRLMVEELDLPSTGLKACRQQDVLMAAPRPPDVSLDSSKAFALGYSPRSLRSELADLKGQI
jgi:dTDP-4-dehydrorhamnose reductase